ncbi:hypothetical protein J6590_060738 [Homalodisca vitripennis]|nr:hypothetical protein J6590_060738 [Homalodisca vitripennis]
MNTLNTEIGTRFPLEWFCMYNRRKEAFLVLILWPLSFFPIVRMRQSPYSGRHSRTPMMRKRGKLGKCDEMWVNCVGENGGVGGRGAGPGEGVAGERVAAVTQFYPRQRPGGECLSQSGVGVGVPGCAETKARPHTLSSLSPRRFAHSA